MELKFKKLTQPISAQEKLSILQDNLHTDYKDKMVLMDIEDITELDDACAKIESYLVQRSKPANERSRPFFRANELEEGDQLDMEVAAFQRKRNTKDAETQTEVKKQVCYNCRKVRHHFKECTEPAQLHCYKCGTYGVYSTNCPRCAPEN